LTLRSKVKVPWRSLWYATHRLMVMHPHTKYHWPISKDKKCYGPDKKILFKKQLFDLEVKGQSQEKTKKLWSGQASLRSRRSGRKNQTNNMSPFVRRGDIIKIMLEYQRWHNQSWLLSLTGVNRHNFGRGTAKEYLDQIWFYSIQCFWTKIYSKISTFSKNQKSW
jgi:hypothetical protein